MKVAIVFGSTSDREIMAKAARCLEEFGVEYQAYAISAHRLPEVLGKKLKEFEETGVEVIVAGAGLAAHLPGVIASKTVIPVVGVPLKGALEGVDALYSIVQMPKDIPVATVGINNARNGAFMALQILAVKYPAIKEKIIQYRAMMATKLTQEIKQTL